MKVKVINIIQPEQIRSLQFQLIELLGACINEGASLGFYAPADAKRLTSYWQGVEASVAQKKRSLYAIFHDDMLIASVQLVPCQKQNGQHRAEVEKLVVHPQVQRQGLARKLMAALEADALQQGIKLLFLDTQTGDKSELFYQALGYSKSGEIPKFVTDSNGTFSSTSYYYKLL
ncbi:GNAT family N-acetyltransferase [Pseudoalteromonas sp. JBTF-M23]|uniref:GNAT family N-acetyltransferase n=1 Tax=Pseudoalteromonas caenipelagi TaxID=2726988 RepID=A0A849VLA2_9GAMM|nr:GNAT family N-acetyltransferase [Pseudoalteromonas caenipelagi]NOU52544.1 GNAT family N-acetyltransferase [Pseudoalteromonas caenipelagi]